MTAPETEETEEISIDKTASDEEVEAVEAVLSKYGIDVPVLRDYETKHLDPTFTSFVINIVSAAVWDMIKQKFQYDDPRADQFAKDLAQARKGTFGRIQAEHKEGDRYAVYRYDPRSGSWAEDD